jgi:hypothetical protein
VHFAASPQTLVGDIKAKWREFFHYSLLEQRLCYGLPCARPPPESHQADHPARRLTGDNYNIISRRRACISNETCAAAAAAQRDAFQL